MTLDSTVQIMNISEDANILASGAVCLKNFLKFNSGSSKIPQDKIDDIVKSVYRLLEPKVAE